MKLKTLAFLLVVALVFLPSAATQNNAYQPFDRKLSKKDEAWIRKTLKSLSLDEKIGQMFLTEANVVFWNRESEEFKKLRHQIVDNKVGGVLVFRTCSPRFLIHRHIWWRTAPFRSASARRQRPCWAKSKSMGNYRSACRGFTHVGMA